MRAATAAARDDPDFVVEDPTAHARRARAIEHGRMDPEFEALERAAGLRNAPEPIEDDDLGVDDVDVAPATGDPADLPVRQEQPGPAAAAAVPARPGGGRAPGRPWSAGDGGGLILGVLTFVMGINYLRGGPDQLKRWFAAKLLNRGAGDTPGGRGAGTVHGGGRGPLGWFPPAGGPAPVPAGEVGASFPAQQPAAGGPAAAAANPDPVLAPDLGLRP